MKKSKSILTAAISIAIAISFLFTSCAGPNTSIQHSEMNLTTNAKSEILNLKRYRLHDTYADSAFVGFLNTNVEEYGYYTIGYSFNEQRGRKLGLIAFNVVTLFIPTFLGLPLYEAVYQHKVALIIYDSNGNQIKEYKKTGSFTKYSGLYYGDPTSKAEKEFKKLFSDVFQQASMESDEINNALLAAGPVSQEKDSEARMVIAASLSPPSTQASNQYSYSEPEPTYEQTQEQTQEQKVLEAQRQLQALSQQLTAQSQMLMNKGTARPGQIAQPYQQPATGGGSYSSQPSAKTEKAICGNDGAFKQADLTYDGYVNMLLDMKTWPEKKYNDRDRRSYQSSMKGVREQWNAHRCENKTIRESNMENWNGK